VPLPKKQAEVAVQHDEQTLEKLRLQSLWDWFLQKIGFAIHRREAAEGRNTSVISESSASLSK